MTFAYLLAEANQKFKKAKIKNPHLEAEILLSHVFKKTREYILAYPEKKLSKKQLADFNNLISRRTKGEPIAYLIGHKEFYGLKFKVNKNVLVPRPETELIVEEALKLTAYNSKPATFIDIGTGSGCIIITLAKLLKNKKYSFLASDISKPALNIAKQNAKANNVDKKIKFFYGNLLSPFIKILDPRLRSPRCSIGEADGNDKRKKLLVQNSRLIIAANLPYLTSTQVKNSPSIQNEPKIALVASNNGLKLYERLLEQIKCLIHNTKYIIQNTFILCEFDPRQTTQLKKLIKKYLPQADIKIKKDLSGRNRLAIISFKN